MKEMVQAMKRLQRAVEDTALAITAAADAIQAMFTEAEIQEARDAGIPLLDYWAYRSARE